MVRTPYIDGKGLKRGAWSEEEDNKLREYILRYKAWNWNHLPRFAGLARCGKSCRMRWENYLKPGVKRGGFSKDDEELIFKMQKQHGNKWSLIARKMPGRTDNEIKNYWHTILSKRTKKRDLNLGGSVEESTATITSNRERDWVSDLTPSRRFGNEPPTTFITTDHVLLAAEEDLFLNPEESKFSMENLIGDISSSASTDFYPRTIIDFPSTSCINSGMEDSQNPWSPDENFSATSAFSKDDDDDGVPNNSKFVTSMHFQTSTLLSRLDSLESFGFWEALWNFLN